MQDQVLPLTKAQNDACHLSPVLSQGRGPVRSETQAATLHRVVDRPQMGIQAASQAATQGLSPVRCLVQLQAPNLTPQEHQAATQAATQAREATQAVHLVDSQAVHLALALVLVLWA